MRQLAGRGGALMIRLDHPSALLLMLLAWLAYRAWGRASGLRRGIRLCLLATLAIVAARPAARAPDVPSSLVVLVDRSHSVPPTLDRFAAELIRKADLERAERDQLAVVGFAARAVVERFANPNRPAQKPLTPSERHRTHLHSAIQATLQLIEDHERARLLVLSDGLAHDSWSSDAIDQLRARRIPVWFRHIARSRQKDAVIEPIEGPSESIEGQEVQFQFRVSSDQATPAVLRVFSDAVPVGTLALELQSGQTAASWSGSLEGMGLHHYRFQLDVAGDPTTENNSWETYVAVRSRPAVLVLTEAGDQSPVAAVLRQSNLHVTVQHPANPTLTLEGMSFFDACVLENVSAGGLGQGGLGVLKGYVEQLGGGLLMTGGDKSFYAGGYRGSPLDSLLPVTLSGGSPGDRPAIALGVVMDVRPEPFLPAAWDKNLTAPRQEALYGLVRAVQPSDVVLWVTMDGESVTVQSLSGVNRVDDLERALLSLNRAGTTPFLARGISSAMTALSRAPQARRHLVIYADDAPEATGSPASPPARSGPGAIATATIVSMHDVSRLAIQWQSFMNQPIARTFSVQEPSQLAQCLLEDFAHAAGEGFVSRETKAQFGERLHSLDGASPVAVLGGYHPASLRAGATANLVAQEDGRIPLAAHWQSGLGRTGVWLFPIESMLAPTGLRDPLATRLTEEFGWIARLEEFEARRTAKLHQSGDRVEVRLPLKDTSGAAPELRVISQEESTRASSVSFARTESGWFADLTLEHTGICLLVACQNGGMLARLPPVALPRSPEFADPREGAEGIALLSELATRTGGREWAAHLPLYDPPVRSYKSLTVPFAWLAALLFLADIADRRFAALEKLVRWWTRHRFRPVGSSARAETTSEPGPDVFDQVKERTRRRLRR
jgi:hypothetical protein